nr:Ig-like domain-containing protein [Limnobaculum zhutongyuii]
MDFTAPSFDALSIAGVNDQVGVLTGNVASGGETDDTRPTISGTGTVGDTITVYTKDSSGNHIIGTAKVIADGTWSLRPASPLLPVRISLRQKRWIWWAIRWGHVRSIALP